PYRLRRYSVFDTDRHYFDDFKNAEFLRQIAGRCYLPANQVLLELINQYNGQLKVAFSISGVLLEQFEEHAPEVIASFKKLAGTGAVEFLNETYYHSLAFLYSRDEFKAQVEMHRQKIKALFKEQTTVFRHTELIYNNDLARAVADLGYAGCMAEGVDSVLAGRTPNALYSPIGGAPVKLLLKNYRFSDDIAFRFTDHNWDQYPLTADKFAARVVKAEGPLVNLFMDYETFGEHHKAETGILEFLRYLPIELFKAGATFVTPSQAIKQFEPAGQIDVPHFTSWADTERDLSAWLGNAMQSNALHELYKLESVIKARGDANLLADWRKLGTSDHFYYMCTKYWADGQIHRYFSPYESPYDSYINFMNVLDNIQSRLR
ncbi:MAG TPA: glycoside hydrolase family 57 protein, partial [Tepidisphaeraceae bacterium]